MVTFLALKEKVDGVKETNISYTYESFVVNCLSKQLVEKVLKVLVFSALKVHEFRTQLFEVG